MRIVFFIPLLLFLFPLLTKAQAIEDSLNVKALRNSLFIEIGGASGHFSINYDRQINTEKKLLIIVGAGFGYKNSEILHSDGFNDFLDNIEYSNISYVLRLDVVYNRKVIEPVLGYSFSHGVDVDFFENYFLINSFSYGLKVKVSKRISLLPKYYFMISKETNYNGVSILHWSGLQIKYNF